jgi:hypothetical protein
MVKIVYNMNSTQFWKHKKQSTYLEAEAEQKKKVSIVYVLIILILILVLQFESFHREREKKWATYFICHVCIQRLGFELEDV